MKNIVKTFGLLSLIAIIPGAMAATSRVSVISKASPRLPSIAGYITASNNSTSSKTVNGTTTTYLADVDCIDNYTACIKNNDTCGSDFEECTNSILLHAKMPTCLNVLAQCSAAGRTSLFGTSDLNAIATYATKDSNGEVTAYTYPTASSVLGQMITAAQIENRLDTDQCVKKYTSCLRKENVCGADFELCTDNKEFKKQALSCESTLARCQAAGKTELFGSTSAAGSLLPASGSRLADLIKEGADLAVNNAVATCNKVTDQCILNACQKNPNKCIADRQEILIRIADATNGGRAVTTQDLMEISKITTSRDVKNYIRQECQQTIGSNRYCYMTVKGKPVTRESVLTDPDNVTDVFDDMYSGEFGRFAALDDKIKQIIDNFDAKVQEKCIETISSCAMRSCGSGIGSVCYKQSRDTDGSVNLTKSTKSYKEVKSACRAIVDVDANCQYAAVLSKGDLYSGYMNEENSVFTALYPQDSKTGDDPIGVVATLNSLLATSYNDAAIENMKKQCQTTALACVKSMCGKDYENCYRNRTDIVAGTYDTGNSRLDRSMNKMGGILDYNIVIGLCMNTVKNASICTEHLKVAAADWREEQDTLSWDTDTVRAGWLGANTTKVNKNADDVLIGCAISPTEAQTKDNCVAYDRAEPNPNGTCDGVMDEDGCLYTEPVYQSNAEYVLENAGKTLFQELLVDVEREVQAMYNAKLAKEQNVCLANNNGSIRGASDNGSTFMWVKLKNNKIPKNYNMAGLKTKEFTASNDLYGSFCRARITVTSDDRDIQAVLGDKATAYFAVGDSFTCGSWIDQKTLEKITDKVGERAREKAGEGTAKERNALIWGTIAPALVGGVASYFGANALQKKGLLGGSNKKDLQSDIDKCKSNIRSARNAFSQVKSSSSNENDCGKYESAVGYANYALAEARKATKAAGGEEADVGITSFEIVDCSENSLLDGSFSPKLNTLEQYCINFDVDGNATKTKKSTNWIATGVGTTVVGLLGFGITKSVLNAKYDSAEDSAVAQWMEEVGEHIQCYLGTEELGSYGDIISFTVE